MFHERLKNLRKKNNITQEELANKINVSRQTIAKWEHGDSEPSVSIAKNIANFFNISVDELMGRTTINNNSQFNRKVWTISGCIIGFVFTILLCVILTPIMDKLFDSMNTATSTAAGIFLIVVVLCFIISEIIITRHAIKTSNEVELNKKIPVDILGRKLHEYKNITRFLYYLLDNVCLVVLFLAVNLIIGEFVLTDLLIDILIFIGICFPIEAIYNEIKIKNYIKMQNNQTEINKTNK